jgi:hypothetical protein
VWSAVYYRIYAEDGAIPSKTSTTPNDPFLGRIKAKDVAPPHNVKSVKLCLAEVEGISASTQTSLGLFLTPYSQSPMDDTLKVTILHRTGPGSLPQEPLALIAKMTDSERRTLESKRSTAEPGTPPQNIRYSKPICSTTFFRNLKTVTVSSLLFTLRQQLCDAIRSGH